MREASPCTRTNRIIACTIDDGGPDHRPALRDRLERCELLPSAAPEVQPPQVVQALELAADTWIGSSATAMREDVSTKTGYATETVPRGRARLIVRWVVRSRKRSSVPVDHARSPDGDQDGWRISSSRARIAVRSPAPMTRASLPSRSSTYDDPELGVGGSVPGNTHGGPFHRVLPESGGIDDPSTVERHEGFGAGRAPHHSARRRTTRRIRALRQGSPSRPPSRLRGGRRRRRRSHEPHAVRS